MCLRRPIVLLTPPSFIYERSDLGNYRIKTESDCLDCQLDLVKVSDSTLLPQVSGAVITLRTAVDGTEVEELAVAVADRCEGTNGLPLRSQR